MKMIVDKQDTSASVLFRTMKLKMERAVVSSRKVRSSFITKNLLNPGYSDPQGSENIGPT